jgi:hypothetical protein
LASCKSLAKTEGEKTVRHRADRMNAPRFIASNVNRKGV